MNANSGCACSQNTKAWIAFRILLFLAAVSLGGYIPYKYATHLHANEGIYAFLLPMSGLLVIAGIVLSLRPGLALNVPALGRATGGALAAGWMATGLLCVKSLSAQLLASPGPGGFAFFHMLTQHVFLSLSVAALLLVPAATFAQFGVSYTPAPSRRAGEQAVPGEA